MAGSSEKKTNAIVSLVTPGWNGKAFVHRLLDSIIAQTYRPIQYIYVDDGSTDGTAEIVKGYEEKFKEAGIDFLFIHQENAGMCKALMNGFQYVKGAYLSNPEYDDILFPETLRDVWNIWRVIQIAPSLSQMLGLYLKTIWKSESF